ncbi:MAG TPA: hypothetical protein VFS43_21625 [Polyangiaceae bacterium]|nr:hypothetical protein [Polyangiaceae bacterium]
MTHRPDLQNVEDVVDGADGAPNEASGWRAFYVVLGARECNRCGGYDARMWEYVTLSPGEDGLGVETVDRELCHGCSPFADEAYPVGEGEDDADESEGR